VGGDLSAALEVRRFPAAAPAWATMVVAPAMGVRQDFYEGFARFAAESGVHVLTFDYSGTGFSRRGSLRGVDVDVMGWAQELDEMLLAARRASPSLPLVLLGHSLGGQLLGVLEHNDRIAAAINVTAGSGFYRLNRRMAFEVRVFWFLAVPLLTPLFGYFPGKRLRMVGDLPAGVARQWRRWCLHPDYLLGHVAGARESFARITAPVLSYSFEDDRIISRAAAESLQRFFRNAALEHRHIDPGRDGMSPVGHFGFFHERSRDALWKPALEWLRAHV
jgi:predicted alpha/beta hydrolase